MNQTSPGMKIHADVNVKLFSWMFTFRSAATYLSGVLVLTQASSEDAFWIWTYQWKCENWFTNAGVNEKNKVAYFLLRHEVMQNVDRLT